MRTYVIAFLDRLHIDIDDLKYFSIPSFFIAILMKLLSFIPFFYSAEYFSSLLLDHVVFTTIASLFILQSLILIFLKSSHPTKAKAFLKEFSQHITLKLPLFCSPAIAVFLGLIAASIPFAIYNHDYFLFTFAFGGFVLFLLSITFLSNELNEIIKDEATARIEKYMPYARIITSVLFLIVFASSANQKNLTINLSADEYSAIEKLAKHDNLSVSDEVKKLVADNIRSPKKE
jgi:hypothetical protein